MLIYQSVSVVMEMSCGWPELETDPDLLTARRHYVLNELKKRYATSDDGASFNESHTSEEMAGILQAIKDIVRQEVFDDLNHVINRYCELMKEKKIVLDGYDQITPDTLW